MKNFPLRLRASVLKFLLAKSAKSHFANLAILREQNSFPRSSESSPKPRMGNLAKEEVPNMSEKKGIISFAIFDRFPLSFFSKSLVHVCSSLLLIPYSLFLIPFSLPAAFPAPATAYDFSKLQMPRLGRGVVAVRQDTNHVFVSWRYLSRDPFGTAFNVYRNGERINPTPVTNTTTFIDYNRLGGSYQVQAIRPDGHELGPASQSWVLPENAPVGYIEIPLDPPPPGKTPKGETFSYAPNDCSVGDVDGDGEYEIFLKWDGFSHDNAHWGYTSPVIIDCLKLSGRRLWRVNLGINIRAGAHYNPFMVYDLDGDGSAELVVKTGDGTIDGLGKVIGDSKADWRNEGGHIITGPEYLTVFSGRTGAALATVPYVPPRGNSKDWGDAYGNRCERYLAAVAYLDGVHPSVVMCRGYYTRTVLAAYDWNGKTLSPRWVFDSNNPGCGGYAGQGAHSLRVGDVDFDGKDEIVYGACTIDHDGKGLYTTGLGHGDALHLVQISPTNVGLQVWMCHENRHDGVTLTDAATGKLLFEIPSGTDVPRCLAADMDWRSPGMELWGASCLGVYNPQGQQLPRFKRLGYAMLVWWTGDLQRSHLGGDLVEGYDIYARKNYFQDRLEGGVPINGSKCDPCFEGDILGDWREEVLLRTADNAHLRLYVSTKPTDYRFHSFCEDPVYRISMATENVGYNQPTQTGFYFGPDLFGHNIIFRGTDMSASNPYQFPPRPRPSRPRR